MTIVVHQRPLEETRSANKSSKWVAEAIVSGQTYTAISRTTPANDIARQLVAHGVLDKYIEARQVAADLGQSIGWERYVFR
jgi:hypothetical protein